LQAPGVGNHMEVCQNGAIVRDHHPGTDTLLNMTLEILLRIGLRGSGSRPLFSIGPIGALIGTFIGIFAPRIGVLLIFLSAISSVLLRSISSVLLRSISSVLFRAIPSVLFSSVSLPGRRVPRCIGVR